VETHNFIEDAEHAAALDQWLAGDDHGLESTDDTVLIESYFGEEAPVTFGEAVNKGEILLKLMGWTGGPLGCRGVGITEPIQATGSNDTTGLGYQGEEILPPYEGEEITDSMKLTQMGANYGVGTGSRGTVFIPRGALKHIENLCNSKSTRENPIGETFVCELVAGQGRHPWRLKKVMEIEVTWSAME